MVYTEIVKLAWITYAAYIQKLFVKEDPVWCNTTDMSHWWENTAKTLTTSAIDVAVIIYKNYYVLLLTNVSAIVMQK